MDVTRALVGEAPTRTRVVAVACSIPVLASVAFLLEYDVVLTLWVVYPALAVALYAGWGQGGILAGCGAVYLAILWRFLFPPLVGYVRWSWDTRYTPPRLLGYKLGPRGELVEGITYGPPYALLGALVFGVAAYLLGSLGRRLADRRSLDA